MLAAYRRDLGIVALAAALLTGCSNESGTGDAPAVAAPPDVAAPPAGSLKTTSGLLSSL